MSFILQNIFKRETVNKPPPSLPNEPKGASAPPKKQKGVKYVQQEALDQALLLINARLDSSDSIMKVVIVALAITFIALLFSYLQFASVSLNDYRDKVKELNDDRYKIFDNRLKDIEIKTATKSGG